MDSRTFLESYQTTDIDLDPLPIKVLRNSIIKEEIPGQALQWGFEYLDQRSCPITLITHILEKLNEEVKIRDFSHCAVEQAGIPLDDANPLELGTKYEPLKLMRAVVKIIDELCVKEREEIHDSVDGTIESPDMQPHVFAVSYSNIKNTRRFMEDRMTVLPRMDRIFKLPTPISYFAVFDGHNGMDAASYGAAQLHQYFIQSMNQHDDIISNINDAFESLDEVFVQKCKSANMKSGSTVVLSLIMTNKLYVAWVGDSQATLVKRNEVNNLVIPHKPDRKDEIDRIRSVGGEVFPMNGTYRVNGNLAVSRAIGDAEDKRYIISTPDIKMMELDGTEEFLILACDGLWDEVHPDQAAQIVRQQVVADANDVSAVSKKLISYAKQSGSTDNISVIVVFMEPVESIKNRYEGLLDSHVGNESGLKNVSETMNVKPVPELIELDGSPLGIEMNGHGKDNSEPLMDFLSFGSSRESGPQLISDDTGNNSGEDEMDKKDEIEVLSDADSDEDEWQFEKPANQEAAIINETSGGVFDLENSMENTANNEVESGSTNEPVTVQENVCLFEQVYEEGLESSSANMKSENTAPAEVTIQGFDSIQVLMPPKTSVDESTSTRISHEVLVDEYARVETGQSNPFSDNNEGSETNPFAAATATDGLETNPFVVNEVQEPILQVDMEGMKTEEAENQQNANEYVQELVPDVMTAHNETNQIEEMPNVVNEPGDLSQVAEFSPMEQNLMDEEVKEPVPLVFEMQNQEMNDFGGNLSAGPAINFDSNIGGGGPPGNFDGNFSADAPVDFDEKLSAGHLSEQDLLLGNTTTIVETPEPLADQERDAVVEAVTEEPVVENFEGVEVQQLHTEIEKFLVPEPETAVEISAAVEPAAQPDEDEKSTPTVNNNLCETVADQEELFKPEPIAETFERAEDLQLHSEIGRSPVPEEPEKPVEILMAAVEPAFEIDEGQKSVSAFNEIVQETVGIKDEVIQEPIVETCERAEALQSYSEIEKPAASQPEAQIAEPEVSVEIPAAVETAPQPDEGEKSVPGFNEITQETIANQEREVAIEPMLEEPVVENFERVEVQQLQSEIQNPPVQEPEVAVEIPAAVEPPAQPNEVEKSVPTFNESLEKVADAPSETKPTPIEATSASKAKVDSVKSKTGKPTPKSEVAKATVKDKAAPAAAKKSPAKPSSDSQTKMLNGKTSPSTASKTNPAVTGTKATAAAKPAPKVGTTGGLASKSSGTRVTAPSARSAASKATSTSEFKSAVKSQSSTTSTSTQSKTRPVTAPARPPVSKPSTVPASTTSPKRPAPAMTTSRPTTARPTATTAAASDKSDSKVAAVAKPRARPPMATAPKAPATADGKQETKRPITARSTTATAAPKTTARTLAPKTGLASTKSTIPAKTATAPTGSTRTTTTTRPTSATGPKPPATRAPIGTTPRVPPATGAKKVESTLKSKKPIGGAVKDGPKKLLPKPTVEKTSLIDQMNGVSSKDTINGNINGETEKQDPVKENGINGDRNEGASSAEPTQEVVVDLLN